jgi:hypothetical protein
MNTKKREKEREYLVFVYPIATGKESRLRYLVED